MALASVPLATLEMLFLRISVLSGMLLSRLFLVMRLAALEGVTAAAGGMKFGSV